MTLPLAALAIGLIAGRAAAGSALVTAVLWPTAAIVVAWSAWRSKRQFAESLTALRSHLAAWREDLAAPAPAAATAPELLQLRDETMTTQRSLLAAQRDQNLRILRLQQDATLAESVLNTMVEGVVALDGQARILYLNRAARRLLEVGSRDVTLRLLHELVRVPTLHEVVDRVLAARVEHHVEAALSRKERTVAVSAGPLPLEPQPGCVLVLHDVTELRRLERLRRDFASNVSHELKTPLTSIQAYADSLLDWALDDPQVNRGFVQRIVEQSERLHRLIQDLIELAKIESQQDLFEIQPIDLTAIVQEALPAHESVAAARRLRLSVDLPAAPLVVQADADGVRTILDNLATNALAYTPAGGAVTIRLRADAEHAVLDLQDTGIGISRDHQERIFERFFRVDRARSREVGGSGLGLAIVKHYVDLLGGTVQVESEQGAGSLFRVRLPLALEPPLDPDDEPQSATAARREAEASREAVSVFDPEGAGLKPVPDALAD